MSVQRQIPEVNGSEFSEGNETSERLIVFGFFNQVLDKVEWSGMAEQLGDAIRQKMEV